MKTERETTPDILKAMEMSGAEVWRNNKGGTKIKYGLLAKGSSDFIGILPVRITPAMVGKLVGVFVALEAKKEGRDNTEKKRLEEQLSFISLIKSCGGIAGIARSFQDARNILLEAYEAWR